MGEAGENWLYLTFDDGPVPGVTDYVLKELEKREQKATFFMVGDNVRKHPDLAKEVFAKGHGIGNHTFNHLNGFRTAKAEYFQNFLQAEEIFQQVLGKGTDYFRPPYGLMTHAQAELIRNTHQIVMWDVLSGDYSPSISAAEILKETTSRIHPGSIVLFHDQQKTAKILPQILPDFLDFVHTQGFQTSLL